MTRRHAPALLGGIGLASTLVALLLAALLSRGLTIRGLGAWLSVTVVVWMVTVAATVLLSRWLLDETKAQP